MKWLAIPIGLNLLLRADRYGLLRIVFAASDILLGA